MTPIGFNKPYLTGNEMAYIQDAVSNYGIAGNGKYTQNCHRFFQTRYGFKKCLLTTSCTDALEMAAILLDIKKDDEIIMPAFTFVSTANAFVLRGAKIVFADSKINLPAMDEESIEALITPKTKAMVVVHYAGVACDMDIIMDLASKYNLCVVEDAAQAIDSFFVSKSGEKKPLGSIGHLAAFSFHETKNITSGEGGMLVVNNLRFANRADTIWEKGTNRASFFRGEVDKYEWVDMGSSFLPSEITAAYLFAQLECLDLIQSKRKEIWARYSNGLASLERDGFLQLPVLPDYATNNAHIFYVVCREATERTELIAFLKQKQIGVVFHYQGLHKSKFYATKHDGRILLNTDKYTDRLLRLPLYFELNQGSQNIVIDSIKEFFAYQ